MIPVFRAADVERAVSPHEAYDAVRGAFEAHARAAWSMPSKVYVSNYPASVFRVRQEYEPGDRGEAARRIPRE